MKTLYKTEKRSSSCKPIDRDFEDIGIDLEDISVFQDICYNGHIIGNNCTEVERPQQKKEEFALGVVDVF